VAKHDVSFSIPTRALGKADVTFQVKRDGVAHGTLEVSNGSRVWFPKGTSYGLKVSWVKFEKIMRANATRFEKR
jgi:hypothetical protein